MLVEFVVRQLSQNAMVGLPRWMKTWKVWDVGTNNAAFF